VRQKFLRRDPGEFARECLRDDHLHAEPAQHPELHSGFISIRVRPAGLKKGARMRPEGQHSREPSIAARRLNRRLDHRLVPAMHAVEHADGQMQRPRRQHHVFQAGELGGKTHARPDSHQVRQDLKGTERRPP